VGFGALSAIFQDQINTLPVGLGQFPIEVAGN
ncbi:uncharacterized protein METZ01_LOCUS435683, partial [marine metagenome]